MKVSTPTISTPFELDDPSTNSAEICTIHTTCTTTVKIKPKYKLLSEGWVCVLGAMIGEDLQKFSGSRVMRTIAIGRLPIRNLPNRLPMRNLPK
ncbi:hypothetical protein AVEN_265629-1 [Araneus ventricosus]|uniref:Uncharacterized protein n=1 Tax=Araneus ventricosus TaxID=182803 RepID=A0A4Y2GHA4_ARAVE|nr:hypothetical protein AVEN_265629-1 [Araneus ventricosus]